MDSNKVDLFLAVNGKSFENYSLIGLRARLAQLDDAKWPLLQTIPFKDPTLALVLSLLLGSLGIDRFYIGDIGLGIAKLLTCGGLGIWTIIDWFLIMGACRERNLDTILPMLQ
ncbi:MAG: TM2 domain-containing protein [Bacteroidales bacterium]|jgi:TM2 domain-containing membrane protein YozV|nr:TM2 domain-containing protein [Bacteroidales bacterium]